MIALFDTHQHLIYPDEARYSWTDASAQFAGKAFTITDYLAASAGLNIEASLFMEVAVDDPDIERETRFMSGLAAEPCNRISGLVASCRPEVGAGFDAWLEKASQFGIVGYRRILHVGADAVFQSEVFRRNVRKIGAKDLVFDLCCRAGQLPMARDLAQACDNTQLVLNHCGNPDIAGGGFDAWQKDLSALAEMPNVACKLSGLLGKCSPGKADYATILPYVSHVIDAFGPDRLVWGSDWPVCNPAGGIDTWVHITRQVLASLSAAQAQEIASGTAKRLYRIAR